MMDAAGNRGFPLGEVTGAQRLSAVVQARFAARDEQTAPISERSEISPGVPVAVDPIEDIA